MYTQMHFQNLKKNFKKGEGGNNIFRQIVFTFSENTSVITIGLISKCQLSKSQLSKSFQMNNIWKSIVGT